MPATQVDGRAGARKAAMLLALLPDEAASSILAHLTEGEVEMVGLELARLDHIDPAEVKTVVSEFLKHAPTEGMRTGMARFQKLVVTSRGDGAKKLLERVGRSLSGIEEELHDVQRMDPASLAGILEAEPPQIIALVLSRLSAKTAGSILTRLSSATRIAVAGRLAKLESVDEQTLEQVLELLRLRVASLGQPVGEQPDGIRLLATFLEQMPATASEELVLGLEKQDAQLAELVRDRSLVIDDVMYIPERSMQAVVQRVDKKQLAMALKGAPEDIQHKFYAGMSQRAASMLREEMNLLGLVRMSEVETAQREILTVLKKLIEEKVIVINKGGDALVT